MQKYVVEFIGTFFLVLAVGLTGNPIAMGAMLLVMTFAGGHISGAHYNPAVTFAMLLNGKIPRAEVLGYFISQLAAGALAGLAVRYFGQPVEGAKVLTTGTALLAEALGTFALAYVFLNVMTAKSTMNNSFYGLAIGFTVLTGAYTFGGISGGAFNPAVALGMSIIGGFAWADNWIFVAGELAGATLAAFVFRYVNGNEGVNNE